MFKKEGLTQEIIKIFQKIICDFFKNSGRLFPFREKIQPYYVVVSEIMLQQTQASRVSEKFLEFIEKFPDFKTLAEAPLDEILKVWKGLGYNRRAKALKTIAEKIIHEFQGKVPQSVEDLKKLPQIGHNTASSIVTFAFNKPTYFIETNIRRVYIYYFFPGRDDIDDKEIMILLKKTADIENPRKWYYALMDYGVMLKKTHPELNKRSKHYRKQSKFKGSTRQLRGKILDILLKQNTLQRNELLNILDFAPIQIKKTLKQLEKEGFLEIKGNEVSIAE
ncbi:MAG: A/G-specific adenine glycosylase [Promethearchaeota archaeon]|nr:MAG: A/G-specific adenine glycosylase [Candidatus Lokiarchaeota archaeon]